MSSKIPIPKFSSEKPFERYKQEIKAWSRTTSVEKKKQGLSVALSLPEDDPSNIRDKVFNELDLDSLENDDGVDKLMKYFDKLFGRDDLTVMYEKYIDFDRCKRKKGQKINEFILEFEQKYNACVKRAVATSFHPVILSLKLIDSSNLETIERKLVLSGIDYTKQDEMFDSAKSALRKFIGEQASVNSMGESEPSVKLEAFIVEHEEALIASGWRKPGGGNRSSPYTSPYSSPRMQRSNSIVRVNPPGPDGKPRRCFLCQSTQHMKPTCPKRNQKQSDNTEDIVLFTGSVGELVLLVREAWGSMILDSACSRTVCGLIWIEEFLSQMDESTRVTVIVSKSKRIFHFGGGEQLKSIKQVTFPCMVAGLNIKIRTEVVESDLPLLLSCEAMKQANVVWDFGRQQATFLGRKIQLDVTSCGHHCIPVKQVSATNICYLTLTGDEPDVTKMLKHIHSQFAHPTKAKMILLLKDANKWKEEWGELINDLYDNCETCDIFQKTPDTPIVAMPEARSFCELIVMDLKVWKVGYIFHIIDAFSRLNVSVAIKNKTPQVVAHHFMLKWVGAGYGFPMRIKFDCGGEFNNEDVRELSNLVGIEIETTAGHSPWMNGLCERNHAITDRCLEKILHENPKTPLDIALSYACNAKNCIQMWNGFSSFQIVFGQNPRLPNVFNAALPELEGKTHSEIIAMHLNTLQIAREAFLQSQAERKLKTALSHRIRANMEKYSTGDKVYFKEDGVNKWQGPGTVIGQDRQVVFVRHGAHYRRIPTCRLKKVSGVTILPKKKSSEVKRKNIAQKVEEECSDESDSESDFEVESASEQETTAQHALEGGSTEEVQVEGITQVTNEPILTIGKSSTEVLPEIGDIAEDVEALAQVETVLIDNCSTEIVLPEIGDHINFKMINDEEWREADVLGRAGKATGKNKNWMNIKEGDEMYSINFEKVLEWHIEEGVNVVMIPRKDHGKPGIIEAKMKELNSWKDLEAYEEVLYDGQSCIETIWLVTEKVINGQVGYKARLVCRGDQENVEVPTDSPTCSKSVMRVFLAIVPSLGYKIKTKDVMSAFLQGKPITRDVYVIPPKEMRKPNMIWKLKKAVYGLVDAARSWYESVVEEMVRLGCEKSKLEPALFFHKENSTLNGVSVSHVDDFLDAGNEKFEKEVIDNVVRTFMIGSKAEREFRYIGINLTQNDNGVKLDQSHYIESVSMYELPSDRKKEKDDKLSDAELKEYRKIVGSINWVATTSRPDMCFEVVELSTHFKNATVRDMIAANKAVRKLLTHDYKILYPPLVLDNELRIVLYSDSAYKNLSDGVGTCGGYIVFLADREHRSCPISWSSKKLQRVVNSTMAAETLALVNGIKDAIYMQAVLREVFEELSLHIECFVDNKDLVEAVHSTRLVDDKLTRLSIAAIKEHLNKNEIMHVTHIPGISMLADSLTKRGASPYLLIDALKLGVLPEESLKK